MKYKGFRIEKRGVNGSPMWSITPDEDYNFYEKSKEAKAAVDEFWTTMNEDLELHDSNVRVEFLTSGKRDWYLRHVDEEDEDVKVEINVKVAPKSTHRRIELGEEEGE